MIDYTITYEELIDITKHYGLGSVDKKSDLTPLLNRWYGSLPHSPDYGVYSDDLYIVELWQCWREYSRKHLLNIQKSSNTPTGSIVDNNKDIKTIVDLGCGVGLTTVLLKKMFPQCDVIGTNIAGTKQTDIAKHLAKRYGFTINTDINTLPKTDLVFASEYFEHIIDPIDHLKTLDDIMKPEKLLIANAFGTTAIGHFIYYNTPLGVLDAKTTSRLFNQTVQKLGFTNIKTKLWNSRPKYWSRVL